MTPNRHLPLAWLRLQTFGMLPKVLSVRFELFLAVCWPPKIIDVRCVRSGKSRCRTVHVHFQKYDQCSQHVLAEG
jgi:hypothetical protein